MPADQIEVPKIMPRLQLRIRTVGRCRSELKLNYSAPKIISKNPMPWSAIRSPLSMVHNPAASLVGIAVSLIRRGQRCQIAFDINFLAKAFVSLAAQAAAATKSD